MLVKLPPSRLLRRRHSSSRAVVTAAGSPSGTPAPAYLSLPSPLTWPAVGMSPSTRLSTGSGVILLPRHSRFGTESLTGARTVILGKAPPLASEGQTRATDQSMMHSRTPPPAPPSLPSVFQLGGESGGGASIPAASFRCPEGGLTTWLVVLPGGTGALRKACF